MKSKRTPTISTKLSREDDRRLSRLATQEGRKKTELVRIAVRHYLDTTENAVFQERECELEKRVRKMENRLASLLVKVGLDVGTLHQLAWSRSEKETRSQVFQACYLAAVNRMKRRLGGEALVVSDSGEASD